MCRIAAFLIAHGICSVSIAFFSAYVKVFRTSAPYRKAYECLTKVAELLTFIEAAGKWSDELIKAYEAMIPKASDGSFPYDQRTIT